VRLIQHVEKGAEKLTGFLGSSNNIRKFVVGIGDG
jgi:hypothetical protein